MPNLGFAGSDSAHPIRLVRSDCDGWAQPCEPTTTGGRPGVSNDFETVPEPDDLESERPDPEEPGTWLHEQRTDPEIDDLDWADQHAPVEDPLCEEDATGR